MKYVFNLVLGQIFLKNFNFKQNIKKPLKRCEFSIVFSHNLHVNFSFGGCTIMM